MTSAQPDGPGSGELVYRIDDRDHLTFLGDSWDRFATANAGAAVVSARVLGRNLWDFVSDGATREVYRHALVRARGGRALRFRFRCDAPARRRLLEMTLTGGPDGAVEFCTRPLVEEDRPPQPLFDVTVPRSEELVRVCAWCKKVFAGGGWAEVEEAVALLGLFERPVVPALTHGMCEPCYELMRANLAEQ